MITREQFLASFEVKFPKYEVVEVGGLGELWVKKLNAGERDRLEILLEQTKRANFRAQIVAATCINQQGALVFADADVDQLTLFDVETLDPIVEAAIRL